MYIRRFDAAQEGYHETHCRNALCGRDHFALDRRLARAAGCWWRTGKSGPWATRERWRPCAPGPGGWSCTALRCCRGLWTATATSPWPCNWVPRRDLGSCGSFEAIGDALAAFGRSQGSDVILGWGYDHSFLPGGAHPTRQLLDQVSDRLPVLAVHCSGHVGVANSAALTLAGITETSPVPRGGSVGRDPETGALTGYLEETALFQCLNALRARQQIDPARALEAAQQLYLSHGITTAQDGYSGGPPGRRCWASRTAAGGCGGLPGP